MLITVISILRYMWGGGSMRILRYRGGDGVKWISMETCPVILFAIFVQWCSSNFGNIQRDFVKFHQISSIFVSNFVKFSSILRKLYENLQKMYGNLSKF